MSSNLKVNSLVPATGTEIGIGTTGGSIDFRCPATFGGNVTIGGTLTYDEVINIDSIGVITARSNIDCNGSLDVDGHTNLDNVSIVGVVTVSSNVNTSRIIAENNSSSVPTAKFTNSGTGRQLELYGGDTSTILIKTTNNDGTPKLQLRDNYNRDNFISVTDSGDNLVLAVDDGNAGADSTMRFKVDGTERLRITSSGNVGIKSTAPRGKLDIQFDGAPNFITFGSDADNPKVEFFRHTGGSPSHYATEIQMVLGDLVLSTAATANLGSHSYTERLRIRSDGKIVRGHTTIYPVAGHYPALQLTGTTFNDATFGIINSANDATGAYIQLSKQRSGSPGGATIVQNDDLVGQITFTAADGTDLTSRTAEIKGYVDGTPGSNDTPGRLSFWTTPDGAQSSLERLRITSSGEILLPAAGANRISMRHSGGGAAVIKNPTAANLSFGTNNQDAELVVQNGGKVLISNTLGLGGATSNPSGLLHCQAPSGEGLVKVIGATNAVVQISGYNGDSTIQFGDASSDSPGKIKYNHAGDDFIFTAGGNTRGRIYNDAGVTGIEHHQFHPFLIGYNASTSSDINSQKRFGGMSCIPIDQDGDKAFMCYTTHWRHRQYALVRFWYGASGNTSGHTFDWDFTVWSATNNEGYSVGSNHTFTVQSGTMSNGKMYGYNIVSSWPSHHANEFVQFAIEFDEIQNGTSLQLAGLELVEYTQT